MISLEIIKKFIYADKYEDKSIVYPSGIFWKEKASEETVLASWKRLIDRVKTGALKDHGIGIYIHVPFCVTLCSYCTILGKQDKTGMEEIDEYIALIEIECKKFTHLFQGIQIETLYLGGGTPSILSESQTERLFLIIGKYFDISQLKQFNIEASPLTTTKSKIDLYSKFGVDRISFGVQSLDENVLKRNNRPQVVSKTIETVNYASDAGIKTISIDVMAGLPGQSMLSFLNTLKAINDKLRVSSLYIYAFLPCRRVPFIVNGGVYSEADVVKRNKMTVLGKQFANTIFSRGNKIIGLQESNTENAKSSLLALGYGAYSYIYGELSFLKDNFPDYKEWLLDNKEISFNSFKRDDIDEQIMYIIINFKTGFFFEDFKKKFDLDIRDTIHFEKILRLEKIGAIVVSEDERGGYFRSRKEGNELYSNLISTYFYKDELLDRFEEECDSLGTDYSNIDEKLKYFFL